LSVSIRLSKPAHIDVCAVDFDAEDFRRALFQHGLELAWDWAMSCPCQQKQSAPGARTVLSSENRIICPACEGSGIMYVNRHETVGMLTDSTSEVRFANLFARYAEGSVLITLPPEHTPCLNDRLVLKQGITIYEEVLNHKATVYRPRFPIVKRPMWVGVEDDQTSSELITVGVLYCRSADANGVIISTEWLENFHFVVTDDGELDWTLAGVSAPAVGTRLGIRYYGRPHFVVRGFPHTRRDLYKNDVAEMSDRYLVQHPVRVMCSPEFLGARTPPSSADVLGAHAGTIDPNLP